MLTSIGSTQVSYSPATAPFIASTNPAVQTGIAQTDRVTLSTLAQGLGNETDNWRTFPQEYPPGFPQKAKNVLQSIAQDPSVSFLDYAVLSFNLTQLPQVQYGLSKNANSSGATGQTLQADPSVFTSGTFDIKSHALNLINQANNSILSGEFVASNQQQVRLLQRFL